MTRSEQPVDLSGWLQKHYYNRIINGMPVSVPGAEEIAVAGPGSGMFEQFIGGILSRSALLKFLPDRISWFSGSPFEQSSPHILYRSVMSNAPYIGLDQSGNSKLPSLIKNYYCETNMVSVQFQIESGLLGVKEMEEKLGNGSFIDPTVFLGERWKENPGTRDALVNNLSHLADETLKLFPEDPVLKSSKAFWNKYKGTKGWLLEVRNMNLQLILKGS